MHILFYCAEHRKPLALVRGKYNFFYRCPEHEREKNKCQTHLTVRMSKRLRDGIEKTAGAGLLEAGKTYREGKIRFTPEILSDDIWAVYIENVRTEK